MKTKTSDLSCFMCIATILLSGAVLWFGCSDLSTILDTSGVRQPVGDVEAFWDEFQWEELYPSEQGLWEILGWDEASWRGEAEEPDPEYKAWGELTDKERTAAGQLGYDEQSWDATLPNG